MDLQETGLTEDQVDSLVADFALDKQPRSDIIVESADGKQFWVCKANMMVHSEVWADLFETAHDGGERYPVVRLTESTAILGIILPYFFPRYPQDQLPLKHLECSPLLLLSVLACLHKYDVVDTIVHIFEEAFR